MSARVTVAIPLYNKEKYIIEALESVRAQTYSDFCILVIDDRSTDKSVDLVRSFAQDNPELEIELIINGKNLGVKGNGNRCFDLSKTEFIARFDADDLMPKERLQLQVNYLDSHKEVIQVGGFLRLFGNENKLSELPLDHDGIKAQMPIFNGISQGTSMFRRSLLVDSGERYDESGPSIGEDWLLFYKLCRKHRMANLPEIMDIYRIHEDNISVSRDDNYYQDIDQVLRFILSDLGVSPSKDELNVHYFLRGQYRVAVNKDNIGIFDRWLEKLSAAYAANGLDLEVFKKFKTRATEQLYFQIEPTDKNALDLLKGLHPMNETHKKYLRRKRIKRWLGLKT